MNQAQEKITVILHTRRKELPEIERQIARWEKLKHELSGLESVVSTLRKHETTDDQTQQTLSTLRFSPVYEAISDTVASLSLLKARFSRSTLNIGVSGRARVGKSTLLQSISGLDDEQIPTGSGLPVTAVRSRIFHSVHSRATLTLHNYESFRVDVLQPYHAALDLPEAPQTLEQFASYQYPRSDAELSEAKQQESTAIPVLRRLKEMQAALPSYREYLTGAEKVVGLDDLRKFVAYPTAEEEDAAHHTGRPAPRPYLAVKDVQIECPFPYAQVNELGIVDLPGLGELAANAEEHHLEGLQNDVDLVMLVKRPLEGMAYWGKEDGAATNLLDKARGFIQNRRDFVYLVINTGGVDEAKIKALRGDILRSVNDGQPDKHFHVLETNTADPKDVYDNALVPVLNHLAERLPVMDKQVRDGTTALASNVTQRVEQILGDIAAALVKGKSSNLDSSEQEILIREADDLRLKLAVSLSEEITELHKKARQDSGPEFQAYEDAVDQAYNNVNAWIDNGFGHGAEKWCEKAYARFARDRNSAGFAGDELNHIRVEISNFFSGIDQHFKTALEALWNHLADDIINPRFGNLLQGKSGEAALSTLRHLMAEAEEPCVGLSQAVQELLALRLDYRTQLHPKVRRALDDLQSEVEDPETGEKKARFTVDLTPAGAERLLREMASLARAAAYRTRKALMQEAMVPALVIHAAVEQFDDALIRSGDSEKEFRRMARCYRDDIWPGLFAGVEAATAKSVAVINAVKAVRHTLAS
ncbi:hypothetical protein AD951_03280 [Acetobacter malorum]|uniref:Dynamin family protein n=1 Tax=Acetobacter malorum TaxID=178901 RepID=A0A149UQU8_9PROT|nr:hypothetical protein [Acetobacter malorum]KXV70297.1 hypothetical protein AD951_03280 [Acetobacter malorum]